MKRSSTTAFFLIILLVVMTTVGLGQKTARGIKQAPASPSYFTQPGHPIAIDDFNYVPGGLTTVGGNNVSNFRWVSNTGSGLFQQVSSGSLSYTGYTGGAGIGNKLDIVNPASSAEDSYFSFPTQTTGTTYAAFVVNVQNTTGLGANSTTGDYFAAFLPSTSTTNYACRVTIKAGVGANTFNMGLRATGNAGNVQTFSSTDLPAGTPILIVISYQIVSGTTNDVCNLFVNPVMTLPEPAPTLTQTSAADNTDVGRFAIRQANSSTGPVATPNASIDGIRIATTWAGLNAAFLSGAPVDFDNDGRTDFSIVRNTSPMQWWNRSSASGAVNVAQFGNVTVDFPEPADYDGDGKTDVAVWRPPVGGNDAQWWVLRSSDGTVSLTQFGSGGDDPSVVGDYDGDGKADLAIYRADGVSSASAYWWFRPTSGPFANQNVPLQWGIGTDFAVSGDYNGDGKADMAVVRDEGDGGSLVWLHLGDGTGNTSTGNSVTQWGMVSDTYIPGDYDGDGKTDFAIARKVSNQWQWWVRWSSDNSVHVSTWGASTDVIVPGDYDGDGKTDIAVWRASDGNFYVLCSQTGNPMYQPWGNGSTDAATANYNTH